MLISIFKNLREYDGIHRYHKFSTIGTQSKSSKPLTAHFSTPTERLAGWEIEVELLPPLGYRQ